MVKDPCVICGSKKVVTKTKDITLKFPNPGTITVSQECDVCEECGETYYSEKQLSELSKKVEAKKAGSMK